MQSPSATSRTSASACSRDRIGVPPVLSRLRLPLRETLGVLPSDERRVPDVEQRGTPSGTGARAMEETQEPAEDGAGEVATRVDAISGDTCVQFTAPVEAVDAAEPDMSPAPRLPSAVSAAQAATLSFWWSIEILEAAVSRGSLHEAIVLPDMLACFDVSCSVVAMAF
eukprot:scaffold311622_cov28-Tisochrysis_lutea.AAC.2